MANREATVFCVLRYSNVFGIEYVKRLKEQLEHYSPNANLICLTNVKVPCDHITLVHDWPGWWSKMELFRPGIHGDMFYVDLDTVILDDITDMLNVKRLTALSDFYRPTRMASGVMFLPEHVREQVWSVFKKNPDTFMKEFKIGGDQAFLQSVWGSKPHRFQEILPKRIISYKAHKVVTQGIPPGTGLMCFHGTPKQVDLNWRLPGRIYNKGEWIPE